MTDHQDNKPISNVLRLVSIWTDFFRMKVKYFEEEIPKAETRNTIINILVSSIILVIFRYIYVLTNASPSVLQPSYVWSKISDFARIYFAYPLLPLISNPLFFFVASSVYCFSARVLGGVGDYKTQYYLFSLIIVPYGFLRSLVYLLYYIPNLRTIADIMSFVLAIFFFVVYTRAIIANHQISLIRSIMSLTVVPFLLFLIVGVLELVIVLKTTEVFQGVSLLVKFTLI